MRWARWFVVTRKAAGLGVSLEEATFFALLSSSLQKLLPLSSGYLSLHRAAMMGHRPVLVLSKLWECWGRDPLFSQLGPHFPGLLHSSAAVGRPLSLPVPVILIWAHAPSPAFLPPFNSSLPWQTVWPSGRWALVFTATRLRRLLAVVGLRSSHPLTLHPSSRDFQCVGKRVLVWFEVYFGLAL